MDEVKLNDLVKEIIRGQHFRSPSDQDVPTYPVINIKDLREGRVDVSSLEKREIVSGNDPNIAAINQNDLLIAIKGSQFKAAIADSEAEGKPISSNIIAFRLDTSRVLPEVISAYLNSPDGQRKLGARSRGSTIPSISQRDLLDVTINLPSMEKQRIFCDYLAATRSYLMAMKREEQVIRDVMDYIIYKTFEVK